MTIVLKLEISFVTNTANIDFVVECKLHQNQDVKARAGVSLSSSDMNNHIFVNFVWLIFYKVLYYVRE